MTELRGSTLGFDDQTQSWVVNPIVRLVDLYSNSALCKKYGVKSPLMKVIWYNCRGCHQVFKNIDEFNFHCQTNHSYRCELCNLEELNQHKIDGHMEERHSSGIGMCSKCKVMIPDEKQFRRHILGHARITKKKSIRVPKKDDKDTKKTEIIEVDKTELDSIRDIQLKTSCISRCKECDIFFPSVLEAYNHIKSVHNDQIKKDTKRPDRIQMKVKVIRALSAAAEEEKNHKVQFFLITTKEYLILIFFFLIFRKLHLLHLRNLYFE